LLISFFIYINVPSYADSGYQHFFCVRGIHNILKDKNEGEKMSDNLNYKFYSGGLKGAESTFGQNAEKHGVKEVTFSFEGHTLERNVNVEMLSNEELQRGDISMEIVSARMGRRYSKTDKIRKIFQVIFHMVNKGYQVFAV
jgi:hypothetical protein